MKCGKSLRNLLDGKAMNKELYVFSEDAKVTQYVMELLRLGKLSNYDNIIFAQYGLR